MRIDIKDCENVKLSLEISMWYKLTKLMHDPY